MTWPSSYAAGTLGYMIDRIDDEIKRSGTLTTQIQQCITDAITVYQKHRFRFSEGYDYNFNTVIGQEFYATASSIAVTGAANNGSGLVRLTLTGLTSGNINLNTSGSVQVFGITGTTEANGTWQFLIIDPTHIDLVGSQFLNAYVSGGAVTTPVPAGQGSIGAGQLPFEIDYLAIQIGTARFALDRLPPEDIDLLTQSGTQMGQPYSYCYFNEQIRLYPVPSAVYPMIIGAHELIAAPAANATQNNRWMTDGERLIRSRAKYELSLNYNVNFPAMAQAMHPDTGATADAFTELKREANKITGTGRVRPTQF
jgi:hypothetical protein